MRLLFTRDMGEIGTVSVLMLHISHPVHPVRMHAIFRDFGVFRSEKSGNIAVFGLFLRISGFFRQFRETTGPS